MPIYKTCRNCGTEFKVPPCRAESAYTCSKACKHALHPKSNSAPIACKQCGKVSLVPVSRIKRGNGIFCSKDCRFTHMASSPEHSARVKGEKNPAWRGGVSISADGYVCIRSTDHPNQSNGYVFEHRLRVEEMMQKDAPSHPFLVGGHLSPEISVHHRDEKRANNEPSNLMAMTRCAHLAWHLSAKIPEPWECWPNIHPGG